MTEQQKKAVEEYADAHKKSIFVKLVNYPFLAKNASEISAEECVKGMQEVINNPSKYGLQPINEWVSVSERLPIAWETGGWDGKRTDEVLIRKTGDRYTIGRLYTGILDGRVFSDWIEGKEEWGIDSGEVTHWQPLPQPPIN